MIDFIESHFNLDFSPVHLAVVLNKTIYLFSTQGVYIAESAHPKIRNNLTILPSILMSFGIWFVWTLGYFVSWRTTAFLCIIPNIIVILCLIPLPESPYWLVEAGKIDLAEYVTVLAG